MIETDRTAPPKSTIEYSDFLHNICLPVPSVTAQALLGVTATSLGCLEFGESGVARGELQKRFFDEWQLRVQAV